MNPRMYANPIFAGNLDRLRQHGFVIVEPEEGRVACGDEGVGRLADIERILAVVEQTVAGGARDYSGVKVLVTAGPTREPIDPVRYISNRSSGKMGYAIAENAARRGAQVTLVSGPTELPDPRGVEIVRVTTVREMYEAVMSRVDGAQVVISAAAPADFTPREVRNEKIKKSERLTLELDRAVDILEAVSKKRNGKVLVGFAAETSNLEEHARAKLHKKNLDLIVANLISPESEPFGSDTNQVTLIAANGEKIEWPKMTKREIAAAILDYVKDQYLEDMT
jgi:phosphopantothenoylcysteine decarboxylase/phosphopantothenate--cysteine ligase